MKRKNLMLLFLSVAVLVAAASVGIAEGGQGTEPADMRPFVVDYSGVRFLVPDHWKDISQEVDASESVGAHYAFCYRTESHATVFQYVAQDCYSNNPLVAGAVHEMDKEFNKADVVAGLLEVPGNMVSEVDFNGITYFKFDQIDNGDQYFIFMNGYMHMFQFSDEPGTSEYPYFEKVMESVGF